MQSGVFGDVDVDVMSVGYGLASVVSFYTVFLTVCSPADDVHMVLFLYLVVFWRTGSPLTDSFVMSSMYVAHCRCLIQN